MYKRIKNIKNEKMFYVWDLAVLLVVIAVAAAAIAMYFKPVGHRVEIYTDGKLAYSYSLDTDRIVDIDGHNIIEIKDGKVVMKSADCPSQTCVHSAAIYKTGERIVCLPNKVVAVIIGEKQGGEPDAIT